ncbi:MAG: shikimate kinase [Arachnia sp.]
MSLVLVGAPGSGKSSVGEQLATIRHAQFIDVDSHIEAAAGKPIAEIFADEGEAHFRELERQATVSLLQTQDAVISLGGGAILSEPIREALAGHEVIWLYVSISQAARRVGLNRQRPLLLGNVRGRLVELLRERTPLYQAVATHTVDTDGSTPADVAAEIQRLLEEK